MTFRRIASCAGLLGIGLVAVFLLIQLIPFGRDHTNPPVVREPDWDSPQTRTLAKRACFDCHSNETTWPWYSNIAPISWLVQRDVEEGRREVNFSDWKVRQTKRDRGEIIEEFVEIVLEGEMPPGTYLITHPQGRLTQAERQQLGDGLRATLSRSVAQ